MFLCHCFVSLAAYQRFHTLFHIKKAAHNSYSGLSFRWYKMPCFTRGILSEVALEIESHQKLIGDFARENASGGLLGLLFER